MRIRNTFLMIALLAVHASVAADFLSTHNTSVDSAPVKLETADLNSDLYPDTIAISSDGTLSIALSDGSGDFLAVTTVPVGSNPRDIVIADLNEDSFADIITANYDDNTLSVLFNDGSGTYSSVETIEVGSNPIKLAVADLDGDGHKDIAVANYNDDTLSLLFGDGEGMWFASAITVGGGVNTLNIGDINSDNLMDIVVTHDHKNLINTVKLFIGDGQGGFDSSDAGELEISYEYPYSIILARLADINADGALDFISVAGLSVFLHINDGQGSFSDAKYVASGGQSPRWGSSEIIHLDIKDMNNDGHQDIVTSSFSSEPACCAWETRSIHPGDGHGGYGERKVWFEYVDSRTPPLSIADFNLDGLFEWVISRNQYDDSYTTLSYQIKTYTNTGSTQFPIIKAQSDFNGNGTSDILWRNSRTGVNTLFNINNFNIVESKRVSVTADLNWLVAGSGDFNGDGNSDILWRNIDTGSNVIFLMQGEKILESGQVNKIADQNWHIVGAADFDADGKSDILWRNTATGVNSIFLMDGLAIRKARAINTTQDLSWDVVGTGDFDGDHKADILWRNRTTGANVLFYMDGHRIVSSGRINTIVDQNWQVAGVGDMDGDGRSDILWHHGINGKVVKFEINGFYIYRSPDISQEEDINWKIVGLGDFNGDLRKDILWRHAITGENKIYQSTISNFSYTSDFIEVELNTIADQNWEVVGLRN